MTTLASAEKARSLEDFVPKTAKKVWSVFTLMKTQKMASAVRTAPSREPVRATPTKTAKRSQPNAKTLATEVNTASSPVATVNSAPMAQAAKTLAMEVSSALRLKPDDSRDSSALNR